jgi:hypothetical protein
MFPNRRSREVNARRDIVLTFFVLNLPLGRLMCLVCGNPPLGQWCVSLYTLCGRVRAVTINPDGFRPAARSRDIEGILYSHQSFHIDAEGFLKPQGHDAGKIGFRVQEAGKRGPRYTQNLRRFRHGKTMCLDDLGFKKAARMNGV